MSEQTSGWDNPGMEIVGQIPSGLYILTFAGNSNYGLLCSWVQQAGFAPPSISVAIKQDRPIMRELKPGAIFCLNQLAKDDADSKTLMGAFARGFDIDQDAFANQEMGEAANGGRYLSKALSFMECRLVRTLEPSTEHNLIAAAVTDGKRLREGEPWVHLRKSGKHY